jgi:hypothetical protein
LTHELVSGRDGWLRIKLTEETESCNQLKSLVYGGLDPIPTDLEIALLAKPGWVYPTAFAFVDHLNVLEHQ